MGMARIRHMWMRVAQRGAGMVVAVRARRRGRGHVAMCMAVVQRDMRIVMTVRMFVFHGLVQVFMPMPLEQMWRHASQYQAA